VAHPTECGIVQSSFWFLFDELNVSSMERTQTFLDDGTIIGQLWQAGKEYCAGFRIDQGLVYKFSCTQNVTTIDFILIQFK